MDLLKKVNAESIERNRKHKEECPKKKIKIIYKIKKKDNFFLCQSTEFYICSCSMRATDSISRQCEKLESKEEAKRHIKFHYYK